MSLHTTTTPRFANKLRSTTTLIMGDTSGVGLSVAAALLEQGANVIISSSRQTRLDEAVVSLKGSYSDAADSAIAGFTCDLASSDVEANLATLHEKVQAHLTSSLQTAKLDHLVYTAGDRLPTIPIAEATLAKFNTATQVRAASALLSVKTFLPLLKQSRASSIVLTSGSIADKPIAGGWSILAFIGAGLTGLTRQLALDVAPIRVNCVAPGVVNTDLWSTMDEQARKTMFEGIEKQLPTGQVPGPDDIAESFVYFIRDHNVTGSVAHTNGGVFLV